MRLEMIRVVFLTLFLMFPYGVNESKSVEMFDLDVWEHLTNRGKIPNQDINWESGYHILKGEVLSSTYSDKYEAEIILVKNKPFYSDVEDLFRCVIDKQLVIHCLPLTDYEKKFPNQ